MNKPESVFIQTKTSCNSRCLICPYKDTKAGKPVKEMSGELHNKILLDLGSDYNGEIGYYFQYEPLTDIRLPAFLAQADGICPLARKVISTNAALLNKDWREMLVRFPLDVVYFNILGGTKKTYEEQMPPLKWDTMVENVNAFAKVFKGQMFVNYIKTNQNKGEVKNLRKVLDNKIAIIAEYWTSDRATSVKIDKPKGAKTRFTTNKKCNVIDRRMYIHWDGTVPLCCEIWDDEVGIIGDVSKENVYDIFNSPKKHNNYDICRKCLTQ